jgi:steroid delta-isomerase-like uncharacterized protein
MPGIQKMGALLLAFALLGAGCAAGPEARNKEVASRVVTEILSGGNFKLSNELYASDFVNHGQTRDIGLAEDQAAARGWKSAFPDMVMTPDKLVAEGDLVTVLWSARGTNTGSGNGLPATGKTLSGRGITIWRIVDGRITEEWSAFDRLSIMQQLGLIPVASQ